MPKSTLCRSLPGRLCPEEAEEEAAGPAPETLEANGKTLRYLRRGEGGVPAILIHGFGGDLNNWLFNHEALSVNRSVYALDLPGHGSSSKQIESGSLAEFTGTLVAFMDAIGEPKAHLVGHSMGGAVALDLALSHPGRALSLVLIAPTGLGPEINGDYIEGFITASRRRDIKPHLEKLFADPSAVSRQLIDDILKYKRIDGVHSALRTIAGALFPEGRQAVMCAIGWLSFLSPRRSFGAARTAFSLSPMPKTCRQMSKYRFCRAKATWCRWRPQPK